MRSAWTRTSAAWWPRAEPGRLPAATLPRVSPPDATSEHDRWDAGAMGCGELVMALRGRLQSMPGQVLLLVATDPGAPEDIPAWCRMTGHALERAQPPRYWIRARPSR